MSRRFTITLGTIASFALLNIAMPEPIVLDLLGASLASLGLGIICEGI